MDITPINIQFDFLCRHIREINKQNGWNVLESGEWTTDKYKIPAILMLIVSELAEALEEYRKNDFEMFKEEVADAFIRILDLKSAFEDWDLIDTVNKKLEKNKKRGFRHGNKLI